MPANFTITFKTPGEAQIMDGRDVACVDQAPTGTFTEVNFGVLADLGGGNGERVCHISTDATLRFRVADTQPTAPDVGTQLLAGGERTIAFPVGSKLWIRT